MKKNRSICLLLLVILLISSLVSPSAVVIAAPEGENNSCIGLDARNSLAGSEQILPTAKSVFLYAPDHNTLVYSWNPDEQIDPSGMNKIMTALLALEQGNPDAMVEVTATSLSSVSPGALVAGLQVGEKYTLRDLLHLMMVGSANDAAAVIAEYIGGNQGAFVTKMNIRAKELGCSNTNFLNPSGLSAEGQITTARDLAKITAQALTLEEFVEIFGTKEYVLSTVSDEERQKVETTNFMISDKSIQGYLDPRVTGGKTGAVSTNERSLISTAEKDGVRYLSVVMSALSSPDGGGASSKSYGNFSETQLLLDHVFSQYSVRQLLMEDKVMAQFSVSNGENDLVVSPKETLSTLLPNDITPETLEYRCVEPEGGIVAPVSAGDVVGNVQIWHGGICIARSDLIAMHSVRVKGESVPVQQPEKDTDTVSGKSILSVTVAIVLGAVVLVFIIPVSLRLSRIHKHNKRNRQSNRRRR